MNKFNVIYFTRYIIILKTKICYINIMKKKVFLVLKMGFGSAKVLSRKAESKYTIFCSF